MKKLAPAPAAVIGGLVVTGPTGPANAQTSPNDGDARQRPERVRFCDLRDENGDYQHLRHHGGTRDLARPSGGSEGTAILTTVRGATPMATPQPRIAAGIRHLRQSPGGHRQGRGRS